MTLPDPHSADVRRRLDQLKQLWQRYGRVMNLTSDLDSSNLDRHIAEARVVLRLVAKHHELAGLQWLDVGSGGGMPGLVIMACAPQIEMTLVEPRAKRAAFLEIAVGALGIHSRVVRARIEGTRWQAVSGDTPESNYDVASARAVFSPAKWLEVGLGLVRPGGTVVVELPPDATAPGNPYEKCVEAGWGCAAYKRPS